MTDFDWIAIVIAVACVLLAAMGAAVDAAFSAVSKVRAHDLIDEGRKKATRLYVMLQDPAPYLNASLLAQVFFETAAVVFAAFVFFDRFTRTWEQIVFPIIVMALVTFVFLGVFPRTLGKQHAEKLSLWASGPLSVLGAVLGPVAQIFIVIGNALTPGKGFVDGPFSSEAELRELVDMAEERDLIEDDERKMIHSVFDLGDTIVKEVMVPRTEMISVRSDHTLRQGISLALRSGFSRIPVIGEDVDDIVGIFYFRDAISRTFSRNDENSESISQVMRPPTFVPDSKPVDDLLRQMQLERVHVVIVVDEFGGTAGLATIEDLLEEIVGEIVDEYDQEVPPVTDLGDGRFRISARLSIDDLGEIFDIDAEDEDVDTVLGLMGKELGQVPIPGAKITWNGIQLIAEPSNNRRHTIQTLLAEVASQQLEDPADLEDTKGQEA